MAEFENGYCTGCGYKVLRWGHRPYCWRKVTMMMDIDSTSLRVQKLLIEMNKHWRLRSFFLCRKKHMYYFPEATNRASLAAHKVLHRGGNSKKDRVSQGLSLTQRSKT